MSVLRATRRDERRRTIQALRDEGRSTGEIAEALDTSAVAIRQEMRRMRRAGWDLPYTQVPGRDIAIRFWTKVDKDGPIPEHRPELGPCWVWTGYLNSKGYGSFNVGEHTVRTHRVAFELGHGVSPGDLSVCHRCDNPPCCNPAHLFLGTQAENLADMVSKGRAACGENKKIAKLTEDAVREIRERLQRGELQREIAESFGVTQSLISRVKLRRTWRHV